MKYIFKRVLLLLPLLGVLFSHISCSEDTTDERYMLWFPDTTEIVYDTDEWADKSYTETLTGYTVLPLYMGYGKLELDVKYTSSGELNCGDWNWSSSDESVATVDSNGTVYLVGAGEAVIEVAILPSESSASSCRDQIKITVAESLVLAEEITVTSPLVSAPESGYTFQLTAEVTKTATDPVMGNDATYNTFKWWSSNPSVASIDSDTGLVTTHSIVGDYMYVEFWAVAVDGTGATDCANIKITPAVKPEAIYFSDSTMALDGGLLAVNTGTFYLEHTMVPEDASPSLIEWTSSNEAVLKVSEGGKLEFTGQFGYDITITAQCYGSDEVESITVSVPAGYFSENFALDLGDFATDGGYDDMSIVRWMWGPQTNSYNQDTDGGVTFDWIEGVDGVHFMQITTWTSGTAERGDLMCTQTEDMGLNTSYPYVVWHIDNMAAVYPDYGVSQSYNFDIQDTTDGITTYPGAKTTDVETYKDFDDMTMFVVMDLRNIYNGDCYLIDYLPTSVSEEWTPTAFNMAHTGLGYNNGNPLSYNLYRVFSLSSSTDIATYLEEYMETWVNPDPDRY
ncbi:MAG: Ig-like domain-containing protein [Rikenellaceae bacterium]